MVRLVVYVPVHYDFAQIEYVAPFLTRYHGSAVFIYKFNGMRDKITSYYSDAPEYKAANLRVFTFSLRNIIAAALSEPNDTRIVFLLTASVAYSFGAYLRDALVSLQPALPSSLVAGVSVVGHCMYGCMSCKGNDHKVPVYFTRYFSNQIPYNKTFLLSAYNVKKSRPVSVLCAPSYGETSILQNRGYLEYLLHLQNKGLATFVWKFHPAVYNKATYAAKSPDEIIEYDNVTWIRKHFVETKETEPCLLPFFEAFPAVLCDLHSSVPFIASYFSPKPIICYWNDADYEVPGGTRDPKFLSGLHVFRSLDQLKKILSDSSTNQEDAWLPEAKGDRDFFTSMYGLVDGNEVDRFAKAAQWPQHTIQSYTPNKPFASLTLPGDFRARLASATRSWCDLLKKANERNSIDSEEDYLNEAKMAVGLTSQATITCNQNVKDILEKPEIMEDCDIAVMTFNMWVGGFGCIASRALAADATTLISIERVHELTAKVILDANVHVVCCQEIISPVRGYHCVEGSQLEKINVSPSASQLEALARALTKATNGAQKWLAIEQGPPKEFNDTTSTYPWGILTRLNVTKKSATGCGVLVEKDNSKVWVFNVHMPHKPYQPYQLITPAIPYDNQQPLEFENSTQAEQSASQARGTATMALIQDINAAEKECPASGVILCGDFNEPSHLDWTHTAVVAGYHPTVMAWPASSAVIKAGFTDAYREEHACVVQRPGWTWCSVGEELENLAYGVSQGRRGWRHSADNVSDKEDRIDFVYFRSNAENKLRLQRAWVLGPETHPGSKRSLTCDFTVDSAVPNEHWTSDHRAVCAAFRLS